MILNLLGTLSRIVNGTSADDIITTASPQQVATI
jgi:hypothetical protein